MVLAKEANMKCLQIVIAFNEDSNLTFLFRRQRPIIVCIPFYIIYMYKNLGLFDLLA